jgi:hypothetical protein
MDVFIICMDCWVAYVCIWDEDIVSYGVVAYCSSDLGDSCPIIGEPCRGCLIVGDGGKLCIEEGGIPYECAGGYISIFGLLALPIEEWLHN